MRFEENEYLTIQLLSYDNSSGLTERFYFLEMSTLQATTLLAQDLPIITSSITAYTDDNKYLKKVFKTIGEFNDFFLKNSEYYIHNCEIKLDNGTIIDSHDDGEVSIKFPIGRVDQDFVNNIFKRFNLDKSLIGKLKSKSGHYLSIDRQGNIIADFETFDDYIENGRD